MADYRTQNRTILAKVEATAGTDAAPVVGTDAVRVEDPTPTPGLTSEDTNEVSGSLDVAAAVPNGAAGQYAATVLVKGSGAGGTAPEYGALLRACALAETIRASDLTGTAQSGAASTITIAAGTGSGVNIGEVIITTGGTGSGQTRVITAIATDTCTVYPAWTVQPDATTTYAIKASALYVPATTGNVHATIYDYQHSSSTGVNSRLRKYLGWVGSADLTLPAGAVGRIAFAGQGRYVQPTDVAAPAAPTYDTQRPAPYVSADVSLNQNAVKIAQMTLSLGNEVTVAPDPADAFGIDIGQFVRRRITGRINPPMEPLSTRDVVTDFLAGTTREFWSRFGSAGNGVSIYIPQMTFIGQDNEDVNGLAFEGIPFHAQGEDSGVYISIY